MGFVKRKASTKAKCTDLTAVQQTKYLSPAGGIHGKVSQIIASLVVDLYHTGLNIVPSGERTMEKEGGES